YKIKALILQSDKYFMNNKDVRNSIIESATVFFSKFGFQKTTMDEIAKNLHKAKGVLYYYFKSKEELYSEVLRKELDEVRSELTKIIDSDLSSLRKMESYFLMRFKLLNRATHYHETLRADFFEKYHFVQPVRDDFEKFDRNCLTQILNQGVKENMISINNIPAAVDLFIMVTKGLEVPLFLQKKYDEYENTIIELSTVIINGLQNSK
ncbi:MAG: TetR/AcrR family transcriptional regulator, partial [Bacteroidales bacterium]